MRRHHELQVWQEAIELVEEAYRLTSAFPREELYGLTSQIRRAAVSVPSNIAEGAARQSEREFLQFLIIARGSLSELETQVLIAEKLDYVKSIEPIASPLTPHASSAWSSAGKAATLSASR